MNIPLTMFKMQKSILFFHLNLNDVLCCLIPLANGFLLKLSVGEMSPSLDAPSKEHGHTTKTFKNLKVAKVGVVI